ncbi:KAT8 regulatory NSL complex subunit 1-like protein isoform X2 [Sceloporus undulatus]|uniref:KAT8 regulatory NSL complex subunit 1-like protein isoform X2 n=1 Tax=Sceloporus undulatus TaxID=8520 RepID=UPI001C4D02C9|nr:KAT8 regulatory NSL complex subunit 1-like protein isoform X2 [Sceloporus undulatus]
MTPALQEKAMKGHGIYLSPSLSSGAMESSETLGMGSARPVKEKMKDGSISKITCSVLGLPTLQANHNTDCFNLKYFDSQSSKDYPLLMNPSSPFSVNNKNCTPRNAEEHNCSKMTNPLGDSVNKNSSQVINSESGERVRGEALSSAAENIPDMGRLLDSHLTESSNEEEKQLPNCKLYRKNGFLGKALFVNSETKKGDLLHQVHHDVLEATMNCSPSSKAQELNFRLLECVNKQQILLNRAKRTQKHLQIILAKHVVKHCDQQMKCFVRHQLQRMKTFHDPNNILGSNDYRCTAIKMESLNPDTNVIKDTQHDTGEIKVFAHSTAGVLSEMEESLDSEATCSSSSEDDDDQVSRKVMTVNYRSDWKWLIERAKVGCRWTWLQAQISELEYKIQQLTDLHRQIRATKGMVALEEFSVPKDILKKQTDQEALLNTTGNSQASLERQDAWPEHDFETSPSSPTLLLRNIEKQSAELSEIISSLIAPLNLSPTSSPLSPKACKQKELVNGISLRDPKNNEAISASSNWLIDQQHLKKRRKDKTKLRTTPAAVMTTSARTRPLQSFQRRKLYKMSTAFALNQQNMQLEDRLFNTEEVLPASTRNSYELSMKSRTQKQLLLELDASFHPVLSFPSDSPLHVHFRRLLKKYEIKGDPFETSALGLEFKTSPSSDYYQYKAPLRQWKCGYESSSKHHALSEISEQLPEGKKKRHLSETMTGQSNNRFEAFSSHHEEQESHNNFTGATIGDMMSRSNHINSTQLNSRRRLRSESSYDIDNIVIPMSLVAPSKLEKLQYKEILTPSWRTVMLKPLKSLHEDEEKAEDLSDDVYVARHAKYEDKERARWSLWEQCHWPKRNRSCSRSSEGQDPALKEKLVNLTHDFSENSADTVSEMPSFFYTGTPQSSERSQEAKALLWERRTFPLKGKEAEALICQPQTTVEQESSNVDILSDSNCGSYSAFGFPNYKQTQKKNPDNQLGEYIQVLGSGSMRKQT